MKLTIDIGGTKTLCVYWENDKIAYEKAFVTADIEDFPSFVAKQVQDADANAVCLAVASPVKNGTFILTNVEGKSLVSIEDLQSKMPGIEQIRIINDIEALAGSLPHLNEKQLFQYMLPGMQAIPVLSAGAKVLVSVGTGLGVAGISAGGEILPSEGGHMDFAPLNEDQERIYKVLFARYGHVSYERLLSGQGITNIHQVMTGKTLAPAKITAAAAEGDAEAKQTMTEFTSMLGAVCGNLAVTFLTRGGVYLGGGIIAKILPLIDKELFFSSFYGKGRFRNFLQDVPVYAITEERAPAIGAAACLNVAD